MSYSTSEKVADNTNISKLLHYHPSNQKNFEALIRLIDRGVVVPFLGAGFSANYGYPGWTNLLKRIADDENLPEVASCLEKDKCEYERAASIIEEFYGGNMEYILSNAMGDHIYKKSSGNEDLELLPELFQSIVITTNFDEVIEMLYAKVNREYIEKITPFSVKDTKTIYKRIACGEPILIKLHGDVAAREFVLTEAEYDKVYGRRVLDSRLPVPALLRDVLLLKIVLFIGCSLENDRTLQVIEQVRIDGGYSFAFLQLPKGKTEDGGAQNPDDNEYRKRMKFLNEHNIIPIWYPKEKHEALKYFFRAIMLYRNPKRCSSVTSVRIQVDEALHEGEKLRRISMEQAFLFFSRAENLIKENPNAFGDAEGLRRLKTIGYFYDKGGYAYEKKETIADIFQQTKKIYGAESIEMAECYHNLAYIFERYGYFDLLLKAMKKSMKIMEEIDPEKGEVSKKPAELDMKAKKTAENDKNAYFNLKAFIITGMAYAYLNKGMAYWREAAVWYQKAEELGKKGEISPRTKAFIFNGLYRYYGKIKNNPDEAVEYLKQALVIRKSLYETQMDQSEVPLVNTHSNLIQIYLTKKDVDKAESEFEACMAEPDLEERLVNQPDVWKRIHRDQGDILMERGKYDEAEGAYSKALGNCKYLYFSDNMKEAMIYQKLSKCLELNGNPEGAMEYLVQVYVIIKKIKDNSPELTMIEEAIQTFCKAHNMKRSEIACRIKVQQALLEYRYDERFEDREEELIRYFEL